MSASPEAATTSLSPAAARRGRWQPVGLGQARISSGLWAPRQTRNGDQAIPFGQQQLESAGNLHNLRLAAGIGEGEAIGPVFADSDVYKWLEAVAWEYGRNPSEELLKRQRELTAIVAAAQREDGYLDSVVQLRYGDEGRYRVDGVSPDGALVAALASWCVGADRLIVDLRTAGGSLET